MAINIKIDGQTIEQDGKLYKPVAIRPSEAGELILCSEDRVGITSYARGVCAVFEEVKATYRTPTDVDAIKRPQAEFWDEDIVPSVPHKATLLAAVTRPNSDITHFISVDANGFTAYWRHCRIPND